jgi:hypothetical protein
VSVRVVAGDQVEHELCPTQLINETALNQTVRREETVMQDLENGYVLCHGCQAGPINFLNWKSHRLLN